MSSSSQGQGGGEGTDAAHQEFAQQPHNLDCGVHAGADGAHHTRPQVHLQHGHHAGRRAPDAGGLVEDVPRARRGDAAASRRLRGGGERPGQGLLRDRSPGAAPRCAHGRSGGEVRSEADPQGGEHRAAGGQRPQAFGPPVHLQAARDVRGRPLHVPRHGVRRRPRALRRDRGPRTLGRGLRGARHAAGVRGVEVLPRAQDHPQGPEAGEHHGAEEDHSMLGHRRQGLRACGQDHRLWPCHHQRRARARPCWLLRDRHLRLHGARGPAGQERRGGRPLELRRGDACAAGRLSPGGRGPDGRRDLRPGKGAILGPLAAGAGLAPWSPAARPQRAPDSGRGPLASLGRGELRQQLPAQPGTHGGCPDLLPPEREAAARGAHGARHAAHGRAVGGPEGAVHGHRHRLQRAHLEGGACQVSGGEGASPGGRGGAELGGVSFQRHRHRRL
mmetsp:Transcript_76835/g.237299  ORF Transcript_76835/g.237299 Transcript_76835/m.237299 type:complete len:445 (-) Transcript_76835:263-1597(-)